MRRLFPFAILLLLFAPSALRAQRVIGEVTNSVSGRPVAGALVRAFTDRGDTTPVVITSSTGRFALSIPGNRPHTLLIRSIGLQALRTPLPMLGDRDTVVALLMQPISFTLETINVDRAPLCARRETGTEAVAQLWTEVTKTLESSRVAEQLVKRQFEWERYASDINPRNGERQTTTRNGTSASRPFQTATATDLLRNGYILGTTSSPRQPLTFRAPDEELLQDGRFVERHCFWVSRPDTAHAGLIALNFKPIEAHNDAEISGVFYIDEATFELRRLRFSYSRVANRRALTLRNEYVNEHGKSPPTVDLSAYSDLLDPMFVIPGGELHFRRLDDGTMLIDRYRMWVTNNWTAFDNTGAPLGLPASIREEGGRVLRIVEGG